MLTAQQAHQIMLKNLHENQRRLYLATQALQLGYGGISKISRESGISRVTITAGIKEINAGVTNSGRIRKKGESLASLVEKRP